MLKKYMMKLKILCFLRNKNKIIIHKEKGIIITVVNIDNKFNMNISPRDNIQNISNADIILESINNFI